MLVHIYRTTTDVISLKMITDSQIDIHYYPYQASALNLKLEKFTQFLKRPIQSSMYLRPIMKGELQATITNLLSKSSLDCHEMSMNLVKQTMNSITEPVYFPTR